MSEKYSVICHDSRAILSGMIHKITETGCELVSTMETHGPVFPQKTDVLINFVLNNGGKGTGSAVNIPARLTGIRRLDGKWTYRIRWQYGFPAFLKKAA